MPSSAAGEGVHSSEEQELLADMDLGVALSASLYEAEQLAAAGAAPSELGLLRELCAGDAVVEGGGVRTNFECALIFNAH